MLLVFTCMIVYTVRSIVCRIVHFHCFDYSCYHTVHYQNVFVCSLSTVYCFDDVSVERFALQCYVGSRGAYFDVASVSWVMSIIVNYVSVCLRSSAPGIFRTLHYVGCSTDYLLVVLCGTVYKQNSLRKYSRQWTA